MVVCVSLYCSWFVRGGLCKSVIVQVCLWCSGSVSVSLCQSVLVFLNCISLRSSAMVYVSRCSVAVTAVMKMFKGSKCFSIRQNLPGS